jgi:hypothetical protein
MIFQKLPHPIPTSLHRQTGVFPDHTLFTEKINHPYKYPEHTAGLGIVTMRSGKGEYSLNGKREQLDSHSFLIVNQGSRLSVRVTERNAQPLLLFFHNPLVKILGLPIQIALRGNSHQSPAPWGFPAWNVCTQKTTPSATASNG